MQGVETTKKTTQLILTWLFILKLIWIFQILKKIYVQLKKLYSNGKEFLCVNY